MGQQVRGVDTGAYRHLRFDRPREGVVRVTLDRPQRLNATDEVLHGELVRVWSDLAADPAVAAIVVTGAGRAFSAGGDFQMLERNIADFATRAHNWEQTIQLVYNMLDCPKPVVSAINGPAAGAGLAVALLADVSIVARSAKLVDGHTRLGVAAGDHAALIWPLLCGMAKAKYHLLTCEPIGGEEAERIGLVSLLAEDDELMDRALDVASSLAAGPPLALRWTKRALNGWLRAAGPTFELSAALEFLGFGGPEPRAGLDAHLAKRAPDFASNGSVRS